MTIGKFVSTRTLILFSLQMGKCVNPSCEFKYKYSSQKPFKCPLCAAYLGGEIADSDTPPRKKRKVVDKVVKVITVE